MELLSCAGLSCVKASILLFYRRLFLTKRGSTFDILNTFMLVVVSLWFVGFFFAWIFGCGTHIDKNWGSREDLILYCKIRSTGLTNGYIVSDLIIDIFVLLMPLPFVSLVS